MGDEQAGEAGAGHAAAQLADAAEVVHRQFYHVKAGRTQD